MVSYFMGRCVCCKGTGWKRDNSGKGLESIPKLHRPSRLYKCPCCEGTGEFHFYKNIREIISPMITAANTDVGILIDTINNIDKLIVNNKETIQSE